MDLVAHALKLLQSDPAYLEDARQGAAVSNTIVGSLMNLTLKSPRWVTEQAVREALAQIDGAEGGQQQQA
jgi:hypothetical protein